MDKIFDINKFDSYREDNRREVKSAKGGLPNSLWETYSSFANCYGGVIILGVLENEDGSWQTTGLKDERKLLKAFWDTINNPSKVNLNLLAEKDVETYTVGASQDVVIVIKVPAARREMKPIFLNNDMMRNTFRRNWEGDYRCSPYEVKSMLRDQPEETMDMKVVESLVVEQLNQESINSYRNRHRVAKVGHPWNELDTEEYLERIGAACIGNDGKFHPTVAGLLMFGDEYRIVREFPEYFLDYREMLNPTIRWTDRFYSSTGDWSGNLYDFYFRAYNKLAKELKVPFKIVDGARQDDTEMHKAIREALANCIVNTDFYGKSGIVIKKTDNSIAMENPGYIRVGKVQMKKGGESDPRNKAIMKMFNLIDIGERAGSGVPELYAICEKEGLEEPIIEERFGDHSRTILTLSFDKKREQKSESKKREQKARAKKREQNTRLQMQANELQEKMHKGIQYKMAELEEFTGLKSTRTREILSFLIDEGIVTASGNNRARRYSRIK